MGRLADIASGERQPHLELLALADDAVDRVEAHLDDGHVLTWSVDGPDRSGRVVGALQLVARTPSLWEFTLVAIDADVQRAGHGMDMMHAAIAWLTDRGVRRAVVGTASAGVGQLAFYQRVGFRPFAIERDHFDRARGYDGTEHENGIPIRDLVWLDRLLPSTP